MKLTLLILSSCSVLLFGACRPSTATTEQTLPSTKPASTPDYAEAIRDAIARNPPGDYNDGVALAAVIRLPPRPNSDEPPVDISAAAAQQIRDELRTVNEEIRADSGGADERQQATVRRDKLVAELQHFESVTNEQK